MDDRTQAACNQRYADRQRRFDKNMADLDREFTLQSYITVGSTVLIIAMILGAWYKARGLLQQLLEAVAKLPG